LWHAVAIGLKGCGSARNPLDQNKQRREG
jgi:hypothetical protein